MKKQAIQKAAKGKVTGAMKRAIAKKKAKKTTELLAPGPLTLEGSTSQLIRGFLGVQLPENPSLSDFFHLLFPDNLFDEIKSQTNKYAKETIESL